MDFGQFRPEKVGPAYGFIERPFGVRVCIGYIPRRTRREGAFAIFCQPRATWNLPTVIQTWSTGIPDDNMAEEILTRTGEEIRKHPWFLHRARLMRQILVDQGVTPPDTVLEAGCGWGLNLEMLEAEGYKAAGLDISRRMLEGLDGHGRLLAECDLTKPLPEDAPKFRAVIALDVIEHIDDDRLAVEQIGRLTEPGGVVLVSVPALPDLYSEFDETLGHRRRYTPETLAQAFANTGLTLEKTLFWGSWMVPILARRKNKKRALPGESAGETALRYFAAPKPLVCKGLNVLFRWEHPRALAGKCKQGTSLFAVARKPAVSAVAAA